MTTLPDRSETALLVIDVQQGVMDASVDTEDVVADVSRLLDRARTDGVPGVRVQRSSEELPLESEQWQFVPELVPDPAEPLVHERYGDACIPSTLHGGFTRGDDVTLVGDAHTTEDLSEWGAPPPEQVTAHADLCWSFQRAPGRTAGTVSSAEVEFGAGAGV